MFLIATDGYSRCTITKVTLATRNDGFHKITTCGQDQARPETAWETFQFGVALLLPSSYFTKSFFFEVGIRPRKVIEAASSGHGTKAIGAEQHIVFSRKMDCILK